MISADEAKEVLKYNPETGFLYWRADRGENIKAGDMAGRLNKALRYIIIYINSKPYYAHRLAWLMHYGKWPAEQIDHINHSRSDNRIKNLREASNQENNKNSPIRSTNKSGVTGELAGRKKSLNGKRI